MKDIHSASTDKLFDAILSLKDQNECYKFFSNVCTPKEIEAIAQRFEVAGMLLNKNTYQEIASKTGASSVTISRVNRSIEDGEGFYSEIYDRINNQ